MEKIPGTPKNNHDGGRDAKVRELSRSIKRLNAVDIAVLILVLVIIGFVIYAVVSDGAPIKGIRKLLFGSSATEENITVTVRIDSIESERASQIRVGNIVYANGVELGKIVKIGSATPATITSDEYENDPLTGKPVFKQETVDGYVSVSFDILVNALHDGDKGYFVDDLRVASGLSYEFRFPQFLADGRCSGINLKLKEDATNEQ